MSTPSDMIAALAARFSRRPTAPFAAHHFQHRCAGLKNRLPETVFFTAEAFDRMWHYVDLAKEEVSWLGTVRRLASGDFLVEEVFLLEQETGPEDTEISGHAIDALGNELILTRKDGVEAASSLFFWGHSHHWMNTAPSPRDDLQVREFRMNGCPYFVRAILNKRGRIELTVYLWELGLKIEDARWAVYKPVDGSLREEIKAEFKAKISRNWLKFLTSNLRDRLPPVFGGDAPAVEDAPAPQPKGGTRAR